MKTPDFDADARYRPLGERHKAVIAPDKSLDVYVADFDHVDLDMECISGSPDQTARRKGCGYQTNEPWVRVATTK
jgi:hypothetical protein